jgi:hypothetical protein
MNELIGSNTDKDQIGNWAYMNRILVCFLYFEPEFESMRKSVEVFMNNYYSEDEHENWDKFLDAEYIA